MGSGWAGREFQLFVGAYGVADQNHFAVLPVFNRFCLSCSNLQTAQMT